MKKRRTMKRRFRITLFMTLLIAVLGGYLAGHYIGKAAVKSQQSKFKTVFADVPLVNTAEAEIGNVGGEKFWTYYGFSYRVSWCACFVSWCEDQNDYISEGIAPQFAVVTDGIAWFKDRNQWLEPDATPEPGDLIFFDWEQDEYRDHVGIVSAVVDGMVFTIEGNSSDRCRVKSYYIGDKCIEGYGHIVRS